jgi:NitT/TauT family transport system substrate-binding protein
MRSSSLLFLCACCMAGWLLLSACESKTNSETKTIRIAFPSEVDLGDIPSLMVMDALAEKGYHVEPTFFASAELAVEALSRGDADFAAGSVRTYWAGIQKGANLVMIMEQACNSWTIYAASDIQTCGAIAGKRLAVSSEGSGHTAMTQTYIRENCPGIEYDLVLVPGSQNRAAALLAGRIDVTPLEMADAIQVDRKAPGKFHSLADFATGLPNLLTTGVYANRAFAKNDPDLVAEYISAALETHRKISKDPDLLAKETRKHLDIGAELLTEVIEKHLAIEMWPTDGGLTEEKILYSINFYTNSGHIEPGLTLENVADLSYLQKARAQ